VRVISLLPAATEIVAALDALDALVGVTHECDFPPEVRALPRVTRTAVDGSADAAAIDAAVRQLAAGGAPLFEVLEAETTALSPDVILTQGLCDVCAVSEVAVRALAARLTPAPRIVSLTASSLDGVLDDVSRVAEALGLRERGVALVAALRQRLAAVEASVRAGALARPRVAVIEWTDPLYAAGHWTPELVELAGGDDVLGARGAHSRVVTLAELRSAAPDVVVISPCGFDLPRAAAEARRLLGRADWSWVRGRPVWAVDANALLTRPGPRLVDGVETFAGILHPDLFGAPAASYAIGITADLPTAGPLR
jgi:iron complex transport system substrate-binding protein